MVICYRAANAVGLMRNGRILAEGPPDMLLEKYSLTSLEEVFLHLCSQDDNQVVSWRNDELV